MQGLFFILTIIAIFVLVLFKRKIKFKKFMLVIVFILLILWTSYLPLFNRHDICGVSNEGGCWKEGMNLVQFIKYKINK